MFDTRGTLQCLKPYDCCMCASIECGTNGGMGCNQMRIGEYGAYGNKNIQILGNINSLNGGGVLLCQGPGSCQDTVITVNFPTQNFALECTGIDSCNGLRIVI